jgi:hypothetical protein
MTLDAKEVSQLRAIIKNIGDGRHLRENLLVRAIHGISRHHAQKHSSNALEWLLLSVAVLIVTGVWLKYQPRHAAPDSAAPTTAVNAGNPDKEPAINLPIKIAAPHLIDNSPPGALDFTLIDRVTDGTTISIPSPCDGVIRRVWRQGYDGGLEHGSGAGNIVEINCKGKPYGWLFGHLKSTQVKPGQTVVRLASVGVQGCTGRCESDHVHVQIHNQADWQRITDRSITSPIVQEYFQSIQKSKGGQ